MKIPIAFIYETFKCWIDDLSGQDFSDGKLIRRNDDVSDDIWIFILQNLGFVVNL